MADSVALIVTGADGTVYTITGQLSNSIIAAVAPPPPAPTITAVQVSGGASTVSTGATAQFGATVQGTGAFDSAVTWAASVGSIDASGLFIAPAVAGSAIITATSTQDASKSGSATIGVQAPPPPPPVSLEPVIPATAVAVDMLPIKTWVGNFDAGTQNAAKTANANGTTTYPVTAPDGTVNCREFQFTLIDKGGIIYHSNVMKDSSAFNTFCYEVEEYFVDPSNLACHEKDLEQAGAGVAPSKNALYVDMATQLNGHAGFLDITSSNPKGWHHTAVKCSPMTLPKGAWISTKRYLKNVDGKNVLYIGSNDNGTYSHLNITVPSQPGGLWGEKGLNCQYQFDGNSAGSVTSVVYARKFRIHSWKS